MHDRHIEMLHQTGISEADLERVLITLRRLERFWMNAASDVAMRRGQFAA